MHLKSTTPWIFSLYETSKVKNKDFARQNNFFPMPMPTSMPMPRFLMFFICLHNQLSSFTSIILRKSEKRNSSNRQ